MLFVILSLVIGSWIVVYLRNNFLEFIVFVFEKVNLLDFDWIYFEGRRNEVEIVKMICIIEEFNVV